MKESKIQRDTIKLLAANKMLAFPVEYRGKRNCPDLMVFCLDTPKLVAFLELKTPKGRIKPGQIDNAKLYQIWGHNVGFCRSADEALAHCKGQLYGDSQETTSALLHTNNNARTQKAYQNADARLPAGFDCMA